MPRRAAPSLRKLLPEALSEQRIQIGSSLPPRLGSAPHQCPARVGGMPFTGGVVARRGVTLR